MKANEQAMKSLFASLARSIAGEVMRRADADGNVPRSATFEIQQAAAQLVQRLFLGRNGRGELAPFDTLPSGAVIPLSPYMRQLWESIRAATKIPVEQNAVILLNRLPADILMTMRGARVNPFAVAKVSEMDRTNETYKSYNSYPSYNLVSEQVFRPSPLATYEAPHTWVDPNGYRLSDRVWNTATATRRHLDLYLDTAIREGRGALTMSRELERFLTPGRALPSTSAPYGTTASYDAMRLARTEISQAHQRASLASAAMNPFVAGKKWNLSASHPRYDICDELAKGGPNGDGVYSLEEYPKSKPHPQCLCYDTNVMVDSATSDGLIDELRADIQSARQEFVNLVGPVQVDAFERLLMGQGLTIERSGLGIVSRVIVPPVVTPPVVPPPPPLAPSPTPWMDLDKVQRDEAERLAAEAKKRAAAALRAEKAAAAKAKREVERLASQAAAPPGIPDLKDLTFVKDLGGSTGARLFQDASGKRYVVKGGNSVAHIQSEALADELYQLLGANVPRFRLQEIQGQTFKVAEFVEGKLLANLSGAELDAARSALQKHFAADSLLASWDVVGLGADNVIVDSAGKAWRIDNGGSLLFRAQGAPKPMSSYMDELWSLRDAKVNRQTSAVFGEMKYSEIATQLTSIVGKRRAILEKITDPTLRTIMTARLDHAEDLAGIYRTLHADKYVDGYIDRFSYHNTWIQSSGVTETLSRRLAWRNPHGAEVILVDENDKEFDDLRGSSGVYAKFLRGLDARTDGKGAQFVSGWAEDQAGSSWSTHSRVVKEAMSANRPGNYYYPSRTPDFEKAAVDDLRARYGSENITDFAAALNALSYETLRKVEVGIRPSPGLLRLLRTESDDVIDLYGMRRETGSVALLERGALESTSLLRPVVVAGANLTEQDVPLHRVFGFYGFGTNKTMYLNDRENELLVLLDGYESRYVRKITSN